ncbi:MAG: 3-deoxy-7-phosphoheptulonate synthase [Candidatus Marinimicrobia bacterium]|nr:3-deoxy-7-phosphoheptulonate synthase [Candidatus Neomarinimicrobiota bacterium]MCF7851224.1 3-deoxy-7-phosphoheptulonate synthase [Candidatus Neomarinimicrobiota bacterium]MCF7905388.1 3-deoxy-7-phosphoheptulonate synthase [Candidatus Neomarinimicrobiota bacterium]
MNRIQDLRVSDLQALPAPVKMKEMIPAGEQARETVISGRRTIQSILDGKDKRFLVLIGPCSIHDPKAAIEYAERLNALRKKFEDKVYIVMRVYFEKPRTTVGWKGLIYDPNLDGSYQIGKGLKLGRQLLVQINDMGLPAGTEFLDPITPQYIDDLVCWSAIGARTTESQTHRQMASGLSTPVGFKNSTTGSLQVAIDAMVSARHPHHFIGVSQGGETAVVSTTGNEYGHMVLRGGEARPNYEPDSIQETIERMKANNLPANIMVDCSHANSGKKFARQEIVWKNIIAQRAAGNKALVGMMLESNIHEGSQKIPQDLTTLQYGVSITDACVSFETTERLLQHAWKELS